MRGPGIAVFTQCGQCILWGNPKLVKIAHARVWIQSVTFFRVRIKGQNAIKWTFFGPFLIIFPQKSLQWLQNLHGQAPSEYLLAYQAKKHFMLCWVWIYTVKYCKNELFCPFLCNTFTKIAVISSKLIWVSPEKMSTCIPSKKRFLTLLCMD